MIDKSAEKKCSQNFKVNSLILPGLIKNISNSSVLRHIHILHYKFSALSWEQLGHSVGNSKTISHLQLNVCNLNTANHVELLMKGIIENRSIEKLDLSDNQIRDVDGMYIVRYLKQ